MDAKIKIVNLNLVIHNIKINYNNSHKTKTFKIQKINNKIFKISKTIKINNNSNFKINKLQINNFKIKEEMEISEKENVNLEQLVNLSQHANFPMQIKLNKLMVVLKILKQTKVQNQIAQTIAMDFALELSVDSPTIFQEQRMRQTTLRLTLC